MTKRSIIGISIFLFLIVTIGVLFGAVFCLRTQNVKIVGDSPILPTKEKIIEIANFKKGKSIFMLDKETATNNIEMAYPYVKVIQIKTTSISSIDIIVRARHEMYYTEFNESYYILDEDLKVLKINSPIEDTPAEMPNLVHIEDGALNITTETKICDFVGNEYQTTVAYELYNSMINTVTKVEGDGEDAKKVYLNRDDVVDMIKYVNFENFQTFNKIIITTKHGVKLDIEAPNKELQNKINICFSTIDFFLNSEKAETKEKATKGTIKIHYDLQGNQKCAYIPEDDLVSE